MRDEEQRRIDEQLALDEAIAKHQKFPGHEDCLIVVVDLDTLHLPWPTIVCVKKEDW